MDRTPQDPDDDPVAYRLTLAGWADWARREQDDRAIIEAEHGDIWAPALVPLPRSLAVHRPGESSWAQLLGAFLLILGLILLAGFVGWVD